MFNNKLFMVILFLTVSACASDRPKLMGVDGGDIPPAFSHFPDVPFPEDSYIDIEETRALGSGEDWIGSLVFTTPYNSSSVYDFYMSEMPKFRWNEVAIVRAKISHMTYIRNHRAVQILIEIKSSDKSRITITAIPNKNNISN